MVGKGCLVGLNKLLFDDKRTRVGEHRQKVRSPLFNDNDQRIAIRSEQTIADKRECWNKTCQEFVRVFNEREVNRRDGGFRGWLQRAINAIGDICRGICVPSLNCRLWRRWKV